LDASAQKVPNRRSSLQKPNTKGRANAVDTFVKGTFLKNVDSDAQSYVRVRSPLKASAKHAPRSTESQKNSGEERK
jgi:hypothetical protein